MRFSLVWIFPLNPKIIYSKASATSDHGWVLDGCGCNSPSFFLSYRYFERSAAISFGQVGLIKIAGPASRLWRNHFSHARSRGSIVLVCAG